MRRIAGRCLAFFRRWTPPARSGAIEHVMSGVNPQGCQVILVQGAVLAGTRSRFHVAHDGEYAERGRIGIFNRSYYEEVLVVRVHPDILAKQKLPPKLVGKDIWKERHEDIRAFGEVSGAQRHADHEILPACLEGRAGEAFPRAHRRCGEELEVQHGRCRRARISTGTTICASTKKRSAKPRGRMRPGSSSRPTRNGLRGSLSRRRGRRAGSLRPALSGSGRGHPCRIAEGARRSGGRCSGNKGKVRQ